MQSKRALIMLALSVLAGLAAVILAARWMGQQAAGEKSSVLVATRDLELGQAITAQMLQPIAWPAGSQPEGSFNDVKLLEGRVVRAGIYKGEPVLEPKLAPEGTKAGLDSVIKPGHRAITVKVNEVVGVAGFLAPGSYVDLLVNINDDRDKSISRVVLERIMVLAVAQEANRPDNSKARVVNAVTLEVLPEQAEKIDLARNVGTLSLMLRNQVDIEGTPTNGITREDLFDPTAAAKKTAAAPAPQPQATPVRRAAPRPAAPRPVTEAAGTVEVIRGTQKSTSNF
ncbi:Flp pilus assembly protein CpaB [Hydrogenophaga sp. PBL-H3]|uniref:Flp pilus assembly protein CpaB n=1 Tax=Hydrogenophaga sp. PBL-H3 TaxID=434010 RepID=UPI0013202451|nr:Flp pilus assembly protein CpaB [Hydrogenophaga sp. PBL-H3]QHE76505.1 Flp pilus assembly protein CpaB [Hydrogenophaga sp. PBL-H3]QHE80929.1 Flp pilus assembly protein CpaB [Hydrogenophaga sp. PBL-H3]